MFVILVVSISCCAPGEPERHRIKLEPRLLFTITTKSRALLTRPPLSLPNGWHAKDSKYLCSHTVAVMRRQHAEQLHYLES